ncbi:alginate export family protein [Pseudidiomarina sp. E22-M8]|uniref:alginate export family protein n=1 Tax=Pseudidiomarina sp. E22-M8 TaxID=3424768 RepID=UPI00403C97AF
MVTRLSYLVSLMSLAVLNLTTVAIASANEIDASIDLRYRLESVSQENALKDGLASTLRSRITITAKPLQGWTALVEVDDVSALGGQTYNSTTNGHENYSTVADPTGTDVNQAWVRYSNSAGTQITAGRQRVNQLNQRFVGGVGWRQNEQTFDGYRLQYQGTKAVSLDVGYYHNVNRIFGPAGSAADQKGSFMTALVAWQIQPDHQIGLFGYDFEFDDWRLRNSQTFGIDYQGVLAKQANLRWHAAFATQTGAHDAPTTETHHYHRLALTWAPSMVTFTAGQERLAGDGVSAFQTPLATLHAFSGFADVFLTTPNHGLRDHWVGASTAVLGGKWAVTWHDFKSDAGAIDYGHEWNIAGTYTVTSSIKGLIKAARYEGEQHAVDTTKIWVMLQYKL